ncbi:MAG TPA: hypothetical protein VGL77_21070 [Armatimonadota bacterium]|jgi:hypothetical protein
MYYRFVGIFSLLALAATLLSAASLRDFRLPPERFQGWANLQDDCTDSMIAQTWRQQLPNLPKGVDGYLMVSYRVITVESPLAATADADRLRHRDQFNDMIAKGYKVTSTPWVVKGKTGAIFSVSGMTQSTKSTRAQTADIFTLPFSQDTRVIFLQVRQVSTADDLIAPERVLLTAGGKALAEEIAATLITLWIGTPKSAETTTPTTTPPEKPGLLEFTVEPTPPQPTNAQPVTTPTTPLAPTNTTTSTVPSTTTPPPTTNTTTTAKPTVPTTPPAQTPPPTTPPVTHPVAQPDQPATPPAPATPPVTQADPPATAPVTPPVAQPEPLGTSPVILPVVQVDPPATAPVTLPVVQANTPQLPQVSPPEPVKPSAPTTTAPDKSRWKTADGFFSCVLPTGWTVSGKTSYLISGLANSVIRLFPPDTYANAKEEEKAFAEFVANQQDIALKDFTQAPMSIADTRGVKVQYTDYAHHTTYAFLLARSGRLWRLMATGPGENSPLPDTLAALLDSIQLQ